MKDLGYREEKIQLEIILQILVSGTIILLLKKRKYINKSRRNRIRKIILFNNDPVCNLNIILSYYNFIFITEILRIIFMEGIS